MRAIQKRILFLVLMLGAVLLLSRNAYCGNIKITNQSVGTLSGGSTAVSFDLTWSKSWRHTDSGAPAPNNWDAAWVFVKFRKNGGEWAHASLNDTGHSMGTGTAATYSVGYPDTSSSFNIATNPGVGVFIYRSGDGSGTFTITGASVSWNYSQDGVTGSDSVEVRVFGIEMVHIPTGAFFAGDGHPSTANRFKQGSSDDDPWYVGSESAFTTGTQTGTGTNVAETAAEYYDPLDTSGYTLAAAFPKGYQAFYMMKGEVSQGQWVAFFNTLNANQKNTRDMTAGVYDSTGKASDNLTDRNNVSWGGSGDATLPVAGGATYETVAMTFISWADLTAYLDWAGLRPMSELEYERAGRGPYRGVAGEYAWGNVTATQATSINNAGTATEAPGVAANCVYNQGVSGPMRVGAMAYGDATRIESGAGYYGNMDLTGNAWERAVTVSNTAGRAFQGRYHGNGVLTNVVSNYGNANESTWPGTTADGTGRRGGSWRVGISRARLSGRDYMTTTDAARVNHYGGRGVRTAPVVP